MKTKRAMHDMSGSAELTALMIWICSRSSSSAKADISVAVAPSSAWLWPCEEKMAVFCTKVFPEEKPTVFPGVGVRTCPVVDEM